MEKNFKELAQETKARLRKRGEYGSSSDLYVNEEAGVAVIGIQTSGSGYGHDTIYVLRKEGGLVKVLDENFRSGRMFPTDILEDGTGFKYTIKDESGEFHDKEYKF
ncbi:MAG: hypothetical protein KJ646_02225 [Nanoarchaeota archaeon]|nr:hypothetical protein [Nanoarchaeota archaeon]